MKNKAAGKTIHKNRSKTERRETNTIQYMTMTGHVGIQFFTRKPGMMDFFVLNLTYLMMTAPGRPCIGRLQIPYKCSVVINMQNSTDPSTKFSTLRSRKDCWSPLLYFPRNGEAVLTDTRCPVLPTDIYLNHGNDSPSVFSSHFLTVYVCDCECPKGLQREYFKIYCNWVEQGYWDLA